MIFQLTHTTYDTSTHFYFEAPEGTTEADFKALCDRLMRESAHDAVLGKHSMRIYGAGLVGSATNSYATKSLPGCGNTNTRK